MLVADKKNKATYIVQMSWLRAAQNNAGNMRHIFGYRQAVKATDFDSVIRWFESN